MVSTGVILGLAGGVVLLYYFINHDSDSVPGDPKEKVAHRNVNWVFEDYSTNINNPLYTKNRFQDGAVVTSVTDGTNGQELMAVSHANGTTPLYRMPARW